MFFSIMVYHKRLSIVPCAAQQVLAVSPFCILCTNLHLLILNAHCIPPLPSILLGNHGSLSVSLFLIQRWVPRGSGAARRLSFSAWLPSLGVSPLGPSCSRSAPAALVAVPQPPTAADAEVRHWLP